MSNLLPPIPGNRILPATQVRAAFDPEAASLASRFRVVSVFRALKRWRWVVLGIIGVTLLATVALVRLEQPIYRATGMIRIADARRGMTGGIDATPSAEVAPSTVIDPLQSQLNILLGRTLIGQVVDREGLRVTPTPGLARRYLADTIAVILAPEESSELTLRFDPAGVVAATSSDSLRAAYGAPLEIGGVRIIVRARPPISGARLSVAHRESAIDDVLRHLNAAARERTDAIKIDFTAQEPRLAQRVVNSLIETYQRANVQAAQQRSNRRAVFLEEQLRRTDSTLAVSQATLSEFRRRERVYSSRERGTLAQQEVLAASAKREEMEANVRTLHRLLASVATATATERRRLIGIIVSTPAVMGNEIISQLNSQLSRYASTLDSMTSGALALATTHPDVQRLDAQIANTESRLIDAARSQEVALAARVTALGAVQARGAAELEGLPATEAEELRLAQQVETFTKLADQLRDELQRTRIVQAVEVGQVEIVYGASVPQTPAGAGRVLKIGLGLLLGLLLACGTVLMLDVGSTTLRETAQLDALLSVPRFALIPRTERSNGEAKSRRLTAPRGSAQGLKPPSLLTTMNSQSPASQAYRLLRTNISYAGGVTALRSIGITSASSGEGKTTVAANLAVTFAQQGRRVLLIDGDLHRPRAHQLFGIARQPGLSDLLNKEVLAFDVIHETALKELFVLPSGTPVANASDLLSTGRMQEVLRGLGDHYEMVVVDMPPVLAMPDASILASIVDGVVLVVRAGATKTGAISRARSQLELVGAVLLGSVLNDPDAQSPREEHYEYYRTET